jgi:DNA-binding transcriptional LysR family regulator
MAFAGTELMPMAVADFRHANPHIEMELRHIRIQGQKLALASDEVDVGYMIGHFEHTDNHSLTLSAEPLYVVTPHSHALLRKTSVVPNDLPAEDLILGDMRKSGEFRWCLNDMLASEGVALLVKVQASDPLALMASSRRASASPSSPNA